jgi:hypothetical protein
MPTVTALAEVDICNMALSHISISQTINSINPPDPGSVSAQACAFWYGKRRDWLLKSAPWSFAFTCAVLTSDATVFPGYAYSFEYPSDCLQAVAVTTSAGQRATMGVWSSKWYPQGCIGLGTPKIPYKVVQSQASPGELIVCCDLPSTPQAPLYLFYIQAVTNTALFDVMFSDALSYDIAAHVGGILRTDKSMVQAAEQRASNMRLQAIAQFMNEMQQDPARDSPSIMIRY